MNYKIYTEFPLICIVAMNENRIIGDGKKLLWHLPGDLKRLKSITMGSPLIMGRKTWESIGRPLPGRASVVLTTSKSWSAKGAIKANSFKDAMIKSNEWIIENKNSKEINIQEKIFLFGGADIYKLGIDFCDTIEVTKVFFEYKVGPRFPVLNDLHWNMKKIEHHDKTEDVPEYSHWQYNRVKI
ncbi:dihydrofolate reductase [Alphaproteobacteria bacterium]|nr:dihydrofolate reductase [Alphaproteobacteria bacterium]